jgi:hypothetical protein
MLYISGELYLLPPEGEFLPLYHRIWSANREMMTMEEYLSYRMYTLEHFNCSATFHNWFSKLQHTDLQEFLLKQFLFKYLGYISHSQSVNLVPAYQYQVAIYSIMCTTWSNPHATIWQNLFKFSVTLQQVCQNNTVMCIPTARQRSCKLASLTQDGVFHGICSEGL